MTYNEVEFLLDSLGIDVVIIETERISSKSPAEVQGIVFQSMYKHYLEVTGDETCSLGLFEDKDFFFSVKFIPMTMGSRVEVTRRFK